MHTLITEILVAATAGLIGLPILTRRFRSSFRPREHVNLNTFVILAGFGVLELALLLCAIPMISTLGGTGITPRHFFYADGTVGWVSISMAALVLASSFAGITRYRATQAVLFVEPWVGTHRSLNTYDIATLQTSLPLAYSVGGKHPQIVISSGLSDLLTPAELAAVIAHEAAHLRLKHTTLLAVTAAFQPIARLVPGLPRVLAAARFAVEHAADRETGDAISTCSALRKLSLAPSATFAAFTASSTVDRIRALEDVSEGRHAIVRAAVYGSAGILVAVSCWALYHFWM